MTPSEHSESSPSSNGIVYVLALYVTGQSVRSQSAIANLRRLRDHLGSSCEVIVVDVLERPQAAEDDRILATPTLVRRRPLPSRRVIGDLSDPAKLSQWLELPIPLAAGESPT